MSWQVGFSVYCHHPPLLDGMFIQSGSLQRDMALDPQLMEHSSTEIPEDLAHDF